MGILSKLGFGRKNDPLAGIDASSPLGAGQPSAYPGNNQSFDPGLGQQGFQDPGAPQTFDPGLPQSNPDTLAGFPGSNPGSPSNAFSQPNQFQTPSSNNQDMELISSKLDVIKAHLETLNQRVANLEHIARQHNDHESKERFY